jgi:hypothetical protein
LTREYRTGIIEKIDLHCRIPAEVDEVGTAECQDGVIVANDYDVSINILNRFWEYP